MAYQEWGVAILHFYGDNFEILDLKFRRKLHTAPVGAAIVAPSPGDTMARYPPVWRFKEQYTVCKKSQDFNQKNLQVFKPGNCGHPNFQGVRL